MIKDKNVLTKDDIVKDFKESEMKLQKLFIEYFQVELDNQKARQCEKTKIPEYLILAEAGEGKSYTAQECLRLLIKYTNSNADLQNCLIDVFIFNLSFEDGTKLIWEDEIMSFKNNFKNQYDVIPEYVLCRIAKYRTQEIKDLNVIIILDGHGRALEALGEAVVDKNMNKVNYIDLINNISVNKDQTIFELDGQKINVDDVIQFGLVRFESSDPDRVVGYLLCPYIWLWIMAHAYHENINDPLLRSWDCAYYNEVLSESGEPSTSVQIIERTKHFSKIFEEEYNKATSSGDIFIFYTSAFCQNLELQPMSAIVNKENWKEYFGPFAGRCYNYAMGPPDINKATFTQLTGFEKIAKKRARIIMEERDRVEFFDFCVV
ncbi:9293_t:CDS:2 [Funneliformis caledonium]|uniref:9293_t:CDS:1 n=1 Tax=Funneliformis caledonium TaxID=1117310 RepID=A0A9N8Z9K3_9GLOM|nr:9293_t:CDS:2 [Funneliformis caledonium]